MVAKDRLFVIDTQPFDWLSDKLDELSENLDDMRPLFEQFASDFYKDEKKIFSLNGPGQYADLSDNPKGKGYKSYKIKHKGKAYPILLFSGVLARSLLTRSAPGSVLMIKRDDFYIGTSIPYGAYHMTGTSKMPQRPLWFIDDNSPLQKRWLDTLQVYIDKSIAGAFS